MSTHRIDVAFTTNVPLDEDSNAASQSRAAARAKLEPRRGMAPRLQGTRADVLVDRSSRDRHRNHCRARRRGSVDLYGPGPAPRGGARPLARHHDLPRRRCGDEQRCARPVRQVAGRPMEGRRRLQRRLDDWRLRRRARVRADSDDGADGGVRAGDGRLCGRHAREALGSSERRRAARLAARARGGGRRCRAGRDRHRDRRTRRWVRCRAVAGARRACADALGGRHVAVRHRDGYVGEPRRSRFAPPHRLAAGRLSRRNGVGWELDGSEARRTRRRRSASADLRRPHARGRGHPARQLNRERARARHRIRRLGDARARCFPFRANERTRRRVPPGHVDRSVRSDPA